MIYWLLDKRQDFGKFKSDLQSTEELKGMTTDGAPANRPSSKFSGRQCLTDPLVDGRTYTEKT